jgi:hypothetical protein
MALIGLLRTHQKSRYQSTDWLPKKKWNNLLALLRHDPRQTQTLLRVGLGGALLIVLWLSLGGIVLSQILVSLLGIVFTTTYGTALVALGGKLVQSAGRWEVDAAVNAQRLLESDFRRAPAGPAPGAPATTAPNPPLLGDVIQAIQEAGAVSTASRFQEVYFLTRLNEDVQKARREGSRLSVLVLEVDLPTSDPDDAEVDKLAVDFANVASNLKSRVSNPLQIGRTEYAFYVPGADRTMAESVMRSFVQALSAYWCQFGLAVYPENGSNAEGLLEAARGHRERGQGVAQGSNGGLLGSILRRASV